MNDPSKKIFIILLSTFCIGCSPVMPRDSSDKLVETSENFSEQHKIVGYKEDPPPFRLQILSESNDGKQVQVKTRVIPLAGRVDGDVALILSLYRDGVLLANKINCVVDECEALPASTNSKVAASRPYESKLRSYYDITLSAVSGNITDYRVDLLWGNEAKEYLSQLPQESSKHALISPQLINLKVNQTRTNCTDYSCQVAYNINAVISNQSSAILKEVVLGAGFLLQSDLQNMDANGKNPENEEEIPLTELYLEANSSKNIELLLEQEVPRAMLSQIVPNLRILTHEYQTN